MPVGAIAPSSSSRLQNPWLTVARLLWLLLAPVNLFFGLVSLPLHFQKYATLSNIGPLQGWAPQALAAALTRLGLQPRFLLIYFSGLDLIVALVYLAIGILIFRKKSDELIGLFSSYILIGIAGVSIGSGADYVATLPPPWSNWLPLAREMIFPAFFIFLSIFPDGRFVPRWMRWLAWIWIIFSIPVVITERSAGPGQVWFTIIAFGLLCVTLFSQVYRYRRVSGSVERQQTKWFLFSLLFFVLINIVDSLIGTIFPSLVEPGASKLVVDLILRAFQNFALLLIPLSIGIALFRYRLWDIDIVIRRTLLYGALTGILSLIYFSGVILLQELFQLLTSQRQSSVATVISTLVIAALFNPIRKRLQTGIDRRFYRRRYDSEKTLAAFSAALRNEVDLDELSSHLLGVVQETMQPNQVSLWLCRTPKEGFTAGRRE